MQLLPKIRFHSKARIIFLLISSFVQISQRVKLTLRVCHLIKRWVFPTGIVLKRPKKVFDLSWDTLREMFKNHNIILIRKVL